MSTGRWKTSRPTAGFQRDAQGCLDEREPWRLWRGPGANPPPDRSGPTRRWCFNERIHHAHRAGSGTGSIRFESFVAEWRRMTRSDPISAVQRQPAAAHLSIDSRPRLAANLVKAGCLVCSEKDIENFTVSQLLRRIRISRGTFYKYFNNKDDFFAFLVLMVDEQVRLKIRRAAAYIDDPAAVVCALLVIYARFGRDYPREAAVLQFPVSGLSVSGPLPA